MNTQPRKLGMIAASLVMAVATGLSVAADQPQPSRSEDLLLAYYALEKGGRPNRVAASDPQLAGVAQGAKHLGRSEELPAAGKSGLPEPGNWSMVLAGLLCVGAIARRRMSA